VRIATATDESATGLIDWQQTDLYRFFAIVFAAPNRECFELFSRPEMPQVLAELWQQLHCKGEFPGFRWFATYELYESAYIALFDVGMPEPPVPLFESCHDKSHPAQEIALENTFFYEVLQLKTDPSRAVPDYLITQLEFLAALRYIRDNSKEETTVAHLEHLESDFTKRHLCNWVPSAERKLARTGVSEFAILMKMLAQFISVSCCSQLTSVPTTRIESRDVPRFSLHSRLLAIEQ